MDGCHAAPPRRPNGESPDGLGVAPQHQPVAEYPTWQQYHGQTRAHSFGGGPQQTHAPMYQFPQAPCRDSSIYAVPSHAHSHTHAHPLAPSIYAAPLSSVFSQRTRDGTTQRQDQFHFTGSIHPQPAQAYQPQPYIFDAHTTGSYQVHTLAAPFSSGAGSTPQPTPPMASKSTPTGSNALLVTNTAPASVMPRKGAAGALEPVSACVPHLLPTPTLPVWADNPTRCPPGPAATDDVPSLFHPVRSISWGDFNHTQPGDSWTSDHVPSLSHRHLVNLSDTTQYYNQSSAPMLTPQSYLRPSAPPRPTPAEGFSPTDHPSSHEPSLIRATLTSSDQIPSSGSGSERSGSDSDIMATSLNRKIRLDRRGRTYTRRESKPYHCTTPSAARKTRPTIFEGNLERLQQRCKKQGADDGAIGLLGRIFANGVCLEALRLPLIDAEVETEDFEIGTGRAYTAFLASTNDFGDLRYICRLCHSDQTWKHSKDVLRHLRRDHFGLADVCNECNQKFYTRGELSRHPCKQIERT